jgi:hypothetical protein
MFQNSHECACSVIECADILSKHSEDAMALVKREESSCGHSGLSFVPFKEVFKAKDEMSPVLRTLIWRWCLAFLLCVFTNMTPSFAQTSEQSARKVENIPWNERTWDQKTFESSYEDEFSNRNQRTFPKDPFIWALSPSFAERFGMPKEWIDPGLNGALAIAWRTTTIGQTRCGYSGSTEMCWPPFTCQMDIYVDNGTPIPWRFDDVERDFLWLGLSSLDFVPRRLPAPRRFRYTMTQKYGGKGVPFHKGDWRTKDNYSVSGKSSFQVIYFDRAYAPGVTLIGFESACPNPKLNGAAILKFFTDEEFERTRGVIENYVHTMEFSENFMAKIGAVYAVEDEKQKKQNAAYQEIMKRFLPGQQP